jgi:hypothetical protein
MNSPEQTIEKESMALLISSLNDELEASANESANRAFNLGCVVGVLPIVILVILTYFLTNHSWVGAVVMFILLMLGLILFANLVAGISRQNTIKRVYREKIDPNIEIALNEYQVDRHMFDLEVIKLLSSESALGEFISNVPKNDTDQQ